MNDNPNAISIDEVIARELDEISCRRREVAPVHPEAPAPACDEVKPNPPERTLAQKCQDKKFFGISISGGGIRSGTFALGILQGLEEHKLVEKADYLSTVSGGGYIASWLQGVLDRRKSYAALTREVPGPAKEDPISFLRRYSNYLAPRVGLSLDAVVIPVIWARNMVLNQTMIIAAFAAAFLAMLLPGVGLRHAATSDDCSTIGFVLFMAVFTVICGLIAVLSIGHSLRKITQREFHPIDGSHAAGSGPDMSAPAKCGSDSGIVLLSVALPLLFGVVSLLVVISHLAISPLIPGSPNLVKILWGCLGALLWILLALMQWGGGFVECYTHRPRWIPPGRKKRFAAHLHVIWMSGASALLTWLLFYVISMLVTCWDPRSAAGSQNTIAWIPPLYLIALMIGLTLQIGLMGQDFPDSTREWLARAGALLWTLSAAWAGLFVVAVFAPLWVAQLWLSSKSAIASAITAWLGSTVMSVLAGKSSKSGAKKKPDERQSTTIDLAARYGPFIAVPGFLIAVAFGVQVLLRSDLLHQDGPFVGAFVDNFWDSLPYNRASLEWLGALLLSAMGVFVLLSLRVNINEFSMHHFYKNRLVRCYLGASSTDRQPNSFTGFDPRDDIKLSNLQCGPAPAVHVPYPILNATLTVTAGTELATQERKAVPWIFTPLYSGFDAVRAGVDAEEGGSAASKSYIATSELLGGGVALGTAMAISGAALNPNGGFHTAPQTAFLMTLFNVRLGWWTGNPRVAKTCHRPGPRFALWWLARELFGFVDARTAYLNLSDGGNFENLGLYELVRRRCRYIIAIDGEEDGMYRFGSLGGAVRKCRADFGVEIEIDPRPIYPHEEMSRSHYVVGRIYYPQTDDGADKPEPGWLLYMKTSITGDEPADVEEYRRDHDEFPQQSTADQFFSESQFESYRRLGLHVARTTLRHFDSGDMDNSFRNLSAQ